MIRARYEFTKRLKRSTLLLAFAFLVFARTPEGTCSAQQETQRSNSIAEVAVQTQPKLVKIFGTGGLQRLESFQTGFFVSSDGLILTSYTYVLGSSTTVVLHDGSRLQATLIGFDPNSEVALLKTEVQQQPHFALSDLPTATAGQQILAFSNLYGIANGNEPCSLQLGIVSAIEPLNAKRGNRQIAFRDRALILDAITNNPGATGGSVTDRQGRLLGMIGRESKHGTTGLWLNYAIPVSELQTAIDVIQQKRPRINVAATKPTEPMTLALLGIQLVPDVVERTPPFIDHVVAENAAAKAGLRPDDLIVELNSQVVTSCKDLQEKLLSIDRDTELKFTVRRDSEFLQVTLGASGR